MAASQRLLQACSRPLVNSQRQLSASRQRHASPGVPRPTDWSHPLSSRDCQDDIIPVPSLLFPLLKTSLQSSENYINFIVFHHRIPSPAVICSLFHYHQSPTRLNLL